MLEDNKAKEILKVSQPRETFYAIMEWLPELLLLLVDIAILMKSGNANSVAGVSVVGLVISVFVRKPVQIFFQVIKEQASKFGQDSKVFKDLVSLLPLCCLVAFATGIPLWLFRYNVQDFLGLPGVGEYLTYGVWSGIIFRCLVVGYIVLSLRQAKMKHKMVLAWVAATLNYFLSDHLVKKMGVSGVSLGTLLSVIPHFIVLYWAAQEKVIGYIRKRYVLYCWQMVKINMAGEIPNIGNKIAAIFLNSWLGPVHGLAWTLLHSIDDVANGLAVVTLNVGKRHATRHHKLGDLAKSNSVWSWATKVAVAFSVVFAIAGGVYLGKWYVVLIVPISLLCKWSFMKLTIPADEDCYKVAAKVGGWTQGIQAAIYGIIVFVATPGILLPCIAYVVCKVGAAAVLRYRNYA